jgi:phosphoadenosine phosphosulfate reductase
VGVVSPEQGALARRDLHGDLWQDDPDACCHLRKTAALEAALIGFGAWITGRKRFQGGVRWQLPTIEPEWSRGRIKINPLAPWSPADVERYRVLRNCPSTHSPTVAFVQSAAPRVRARSRRSARAAGGAWTSPSAAST